MPGMAYGLHRQRRCEVPEGRCRERGRRSLDERRPRHRYVLLTAAIGDLTCGARQCVDAAWEAATTWLAVCARQRKEMMSRRLMYRGAAYSALSICTAL